MTHTELRDRVLLAAYAWRAARHATQAQINAAEARLHEALAALQAASEPGTLQPRRTRDLAYYLALPWLVRITGLGPHTRAEVPELALAVAPCEDPAQLWESVQASIRAEIKRRLAAGEAIPEP